VAWAAADLLGDHRGLTVRTCANPACGWLFVDDSGIRRSCNSGTCGSSDSVPRKVR
jgi:predicted RNA-binding Zn ribbon-like protein